jgi:uncharacterized protein YxjI
MKLYMKEKVFTLTDKFFVMDEAGNEKYIVEGEFLSLGKRLHIYDLQGAEVAFIRQELLTLLPRFTVSIGGAEVAQVKREFSLFLPRYTIEGLGWEIDGSFWEHDYQITQNGRPIVTIAKEWMTWGDSYELDIANPADEIMALAVVLTIDCVREMQQNNN